MTRSRRRSQTGRRGARPMTVDGHSVWVLDVPAARRPRQRPAARAARFPVVLVRLAPRARRARARSGASWRSTSSASDSPTSPTCATACDCRPTWSRASPGTLGLVVGRAAHPRHGRHRRRRAARAQPRRNAAVRGHAAGPHQRQHLHRHGAPHQRPAAAAVARRRADRSRARPTDSRPASRERSRPRATVGADELEAQWLFAERNGGNRMLPRTIRYIEDRRAEERRFTGAIETHPSPLAVVWGADDPIAVVADDRRAPPRPSRHAVTDPRRRRPLPDDRVPHPLRRRRPRRPLNPPVTNRCGASPYPQLAPSPTAAVRHRAHSWAGVRR